MIFKKADRRGILKYVRAVYGEWVCDYECYDLLVDIDIAMLKDPMFKVEIIEEDEDYIKTNIGCFYKMSSGERTWLWAIPTRKLTENSRTRKTVGNFFLTDSESGDLKNANNKSWWEFKKALKPYLDIAVKEFVKDELEYK